MRPSSIPPYEHRAPDWARVVAALHRLRADTTRSVFGARGPWGGHGYDLGPPLDEETLAGLERRHGVRLPEELRSFLLVVGNGPAKPNAKGGPRCGGAGPGYGVYEIAEALAESPRAASDFAPLRTRAAVEAAADSDDDFAPAGLITLGTYGCAWDWGLAVSGRWAGTVWSYVDPGWIPSTPCWSAVLTALGEDYDAAHDWLRAHLDEIPVRTFADAYLEWLDEALGGDRAGEQSSAPVA